MNYKRGELITDFKNQVKVGDIVYYYHCLHLITAIGEKYVLSKPEPEINDYEDFLRYKFGGFYFAIPDCETCPDNKTIDYTCSACQEKQEKKKVKKYLWARGYSELHNHSYTRQLVDLFFYSKEEMKDSDCICLENTMIEVEE